MPALLGIDHVHIYVANRKKAVVWYEEVLGFSPIAKFMFWAKDGGPLTLTNAEDNIHLALFERAGPAPASTLALGVTCTQFLDWKAHLDAKAVAFTVSDHDLSFSLYFSDPDGNPFEITTYEYDAVKAALRACRV